MFKKRIFNKVKTVFFNIIRIILEPFIKIDENLMLFGTAFEKFADNPKYLYLYVFEKEKEFKPVWITNNNEVIKELKNKNLPVVKKDSLKGLLLAMKARYFFFSHNITDIFYFRRRKTIAINLWHGSPLKKIGYDSKVELKWINKRKRLWLKVPYEKWDYFVVASEYWIPFFQSALRIPKEKFLPFGLPRNDILWLARKNNNFKEKIKKRVFNSFGIKDTNKKVILYAPTFRDNDKLRLRFLDQLNLFIFEMNDFLSIHDEFLLFLRLHPLDKIKLKDNNINNFTIIDVSKYPDMQELLTITDILITDYSSSMFDFTILERPIILYQFDRNEYEKVRGSFYNSIQESCFIKVQDLEDLKNCIINVNTEKLVYNCTKLYNKDGKSSRILISYLKNKYLGKES